MEGGFPGLGARAAPGPGSRQTGQTGGRPQGTGTSTSRRADRGGIKGAGTKERTPSAPSIVMPLTHSPARSVPCVCICVCVRACVLTCARSSRGGHPVHAFQALPTRRAAPRLGPTPAPGAEAGRRAGRRRQPWRGATALGSGREVSYCCSPLGECPPVGTKDTALGDGTGGPASALLPIAEQGPAGGTQTGHPAVRAAGPRRPPHERRGWPSEEPASRCLQSRKRRDLGCPASPSPQ